MCSLLNTLLVSLTPPSRCHPSKKERQNAVGNMRIQPFVRTYKHTHARTYTSKQIKFARGYETAHTATKTKTQLVQCLKEIIQQV